MSIEIKIPAIGESITEVTLTTWLKEEGDFVEEGDILCEIESDKATVELPAEESGVLSRSVDEGTDLEIGAVIGSLTPGEGSASTSAKSSEDDSAESTADAGSSEEASQASSQGGDKNYPSPAARKILDEKGVDASSVQGTGKDGRITKGDALAAKSGSAQKQASAPEKSASSSQPMQAQVPAGGATREVRREKMTRLRKTIASRLTEAKNSTAMLTTFNEIDMHPVMELRKKYKEQFKDKHEIGLGFMSFFTKACTIALREVPGVNSQIDGEEIVYHDYADVGIAVSTPKGLVVPVVRNAESLSLAQIEKEIKRLALKGRDGKLSMDDMSGGTFTITNGGVFGSMLSTPIINIPQSAILGMHNIVERPVAINGQVVVHPVMYTALSYDHRVIDGKESVTFLYRLKELIEDPARMLLDI
ncbi:MAG: dihydrolipoyllysine-residue succinyltransferase [Halobacteriovoraceae bacterium]|nr:dihydrolipoyllysine-residue succinyltransferase [Halobacteriovoraceae bacterium]MBC99466.1 dihydrolipoyllysine-residue succinyltransferase [Halobacteriovoraceae bacterium]|tara:strand:+ start:244740 stop:245996 length:1257 start_codon:yes stop_codon:yes gene_type:complete